MKIYQLHKYSGEYEDFCDRIIGSYLRKERAEEEKIAAEAKESELAERGRKCNQCPFTEHPFANLGELLAKYPNYCSHKQLHDDSYGIYCDNGYIHWSNATFEIKEIEVEE